MDDVRRTRPAFDRLSSGRHALTVRKVPFRFIELTVSHSSSLISSSRADGNTPALLHRTSIPPWRSTAASTIALTSPGSLTSARKKEADPPPSTISRAACSPASGWRPTRSTLAPSPAKTFAIPRPIPLLPPVTITDFCCARLPIGTSWLPRPPRSSAGVGCRS